MFDFFLVLVTEVDRPRDARLDPLPPVPADPRRVRARLARERYFTKQKFADPEATIRRAAAVRRAQRRRR